MQARFEPWQESTRVPPLPGPLPHCVAEREKSVRGGGKGMIHRGEARIHDLHPGMEVALFQA